MKSIWQQRVLLETMPQERDQQHSAGNGNGKREKKGLKSARENESSIRTKEEKKREKEEI